MDSDQNPGNEWLKSLEMVMRNELIHYLLNHYGHLLPENERLTLRHIHVLDHSRHFDADYKAKTIEKFGHPATEVNFRDSGPDAFRAECAAWLLREQADEISLNNCARCGGLARTPLARQCRYCGHDWH